MKSNMEIAYIILLIIWFFLCGIAYQEAQNKTVCVMYMLGEDCALVCADGTTISFPDNIDGWVLLKSKGEWSDDLW